VLFASALVTLVLGHYVDTAVILLVAVINAAIGFIQENKAEKALEDIKNMLPGRAQVLRDAKNLFVNKSRFTKSDNSCGQMQ
jgi:magnesium-transporting ATPase (P-type)